MVAPVGVPSHRDHRADLPTLDRGRRRRGFGVRTNRCQVHPSLPEQARPGIGQPTSPLMLERRREHGESWAGIALFQRTRQGCKRDKPAALVRTLLKVRAQRPLVEHRADTFDSFARGLLITKERTGNFARRQHELPRELGAEDIEGVVHQQLHTKMSARAGMHSPPAARLRSGGHW